MGEIIAPMQSMEYETAPEGTQAAICYGTVLLGTIQTKQWGPKRKIRMLFELHGDQKMKDGRPFTVSQDFTFSSNENAALRIFIEDWRGRKYTTPELKALGGLPISKLVGQHALVSISHTPHDDGVWVNIASIMPPLKGMTVPDMVNDKLVYNVDSHDQVEFDKLGKKLQERIMDTQEWKIRVGQLPDPKHQQQPETSIPSDWDTEIPF